MFRRALRLGSRVAVASTAAVVPTTISACFQGNLLSDSRTPGCIEINDFGAVPAEASTGSCISDQGRRHGSPLVKNFFSLNGRVLAENESRGFRGSRTPLIPQASAGSRSACDCRAARRWRTTSRRATRSSPSDVSSSSSGSRARARARRQTRSEARGPRNSRSRTRCRRSRARRPSATLP